MSLLWNVPAMMANFWCGFTGVSSPLVGLTGGAGAGVLASAGRDGNDSDCVCVAWAAFFGAGFGFAIDVGSGFAGSVGVRTSFGFFAPVVVPGADARCARARSASSPVRRSSGGGAGVGAAAV